MTVILYMATTVNGFIAKENDDTSWISKAEWDCYSATVRKAGHLVIGHRTYDILTKQPEFAELSDVKIVVVSHTQFPTLSPHHHVVRSPREAIETMGDATEIIVAGGSILNASFLKEGLIDEVYVDVEPVLLGKGLPLVEASDLDYRLVFIDTKKIGDGGVQLHYRIAH